MKAEFDENKENVLILEAEDLKDAALLVGISANGFSSILRRKGETIWLEIYTEDS